MKFYIYTLGCKVNHYESRVMADLLINEGFLEAIEDTDADVCIINTCSVTNVADQKSAKIIRSAIRKNPDAIILVTGCFAQADEKKASEIPGVSIVIGNRDKTKIMDYLKAYREKKKQIIDVKNIRDTTFEPMKLNNFDKTRAFVKIQDGCNNFCAYCIIPYTRGNVRSKKREDVLEEVRTLLKQGHKEIVLTGIHTGNYGSDLKNYDFADLLGELIFLEGLERLRISSIEMNEINDKVLQLMKKYPILVDHLHIPLQSGSEKILKAMNRKYSKQEFIDKMVAIRKIRPNISITTDVIVGFPGETEEDFTEMMETIQKINFSKLHVFPFSRRKGTEADKMDNQVMESVKKERVHSLLEISKQLEINYMNKFLNQEVSFLPEIYKNGYLIGHTGNYLLVKVEGIEEDLHKCIPIVLEQTTYPYVIGKKM